MSENLTTVFMVTYTTVLPILLGYIASNLKVIKESKNVGKEADILILRLILVDLHDRYIKQGYVTNQGFITFLEVWDLYHDKYKGNHLTEKFKKEIEALPIRTETWED